MKYSLRFYEGSGDEDFTPTQEQDPEYSGIDPTTGQPFAPDAGQTGAV